MGQEAKLRYLYVGIYIVRIETNFHKLLSLQAIQKQVQAGFGQQAIGCCPLQDGEEIEIYFK